MKWLFLIPFLAFGAESPEQLQMELDAAEAQFKRAQEMFNPWYTGPLLTPSATMMPPGEANIQPYVFVTDTYGAYNRARHGVSAAHDLVTAELNAGLITGITNTMDLSVSMTGVGNWQDGRSGGGFEDIGTTLGFCICPQTVYVPAMKFTVSETWPTGKFNNLNPEKGGLDATGDGVYRTKFGFAIAKLFAWASKHPQRLRAYVSYSLPTTTHVNGFNSYGGGYGCVGTVRPGNSFSADLGYEFSITQHWVAALDVVYTATNPAHFSGNAGTLRDGTPSAVGGPYSDNLSLAPAFEYNWNANLGIIMGAWFSVYGRSSREFVSGIFSVSYSFP